MEHDLRFDGEERAARLCMLALTLVLAWVIVPIAAFVGFVGDLVARPSIAGVRQAVLTLVDRVDSLLWFTGASVVVNWKN